MTENVLVTVTAPGGYQSDWELPGNVPVEKLALPCTQALHRLFPHEYPAAQEVRLYAGGVPLDPEQDLLSQGVWDGCFLEFRTV